MTQENTNPIVIYEGADKTVEVRLDANQETVWLTQQQMVDLFGKNVRTAPVMRRLSYSLVIWSDRFGERMKVLNKIASFVTRRKKKTFEELNDWLLTALGVSAFLVAGYWGLMLSDVVPSFIKVVNENGVSLFAAGFALLLGGFGISVWFFGCIAARCHTLLYERWFK